MKRVLSAILCLLLITTNAFATVGSCVQDSRTFYENAEGYKDKVMVKYLCTGGTGDDNGTVSNTTVSGLQGWYLYSLSAYPGETAPTDNSDLTLLDAGSEDLLGATGTDIIDATTKKTTVPKAGFITTIFNYLINSALTMVVTNNAATSSTFYIEITANR